jgi:lysophospholipase L1-like esterase
MRFLAALLMTASFALGGARIVLVGDSTVNDEGGWGTGFKASFAPEVEVVNLALNGRSTKSFRDEGHWAPALTAKADYILIQFGHNDGPGKGPDRETDAGSTYRANLVRYIEEARGAGAKPVLVTSIVRRVFTPEGKIVADTLVPYVEAARSVAAEQHVPLMEMYGLTKAQAESLGPERTAELNALTADGKPDTTHLGAKGRDAVGVIAAQEFVRVVPDLGKYLRSAGSNSR